MISLEKTLAELFIFIYSAEETVLQSYLFP